MDFYNKPIDSKLYVPFTPNHPLCCLQNIPFSLARRICTIAEDENVKEQRFKQPKKTLLDSKYLNLLMEASILKAKKIPFEVL